MIFGGPDGDILEGDSGRDRILGGAGADVLLARDGEADVIECGPAIDKAYVDVRDKTQGCERIASGPSRR